ncbi:unnamed protein product [Ilex paraguariensis]|uniref:RNase H type-1 domain-containing protein n=1 Tax=Ilex paraguariensis TaxID=185542 RepID=A0ABC8TMJ3_9AQUA
MVRNNDSAKPNDINVAFDLDNTREIAGEDMENGRNMPILGHPTFPEKMTDIGNSKADEMITEPVPQDMNNNSDTVKVVAGDMEIQNGDTERVDVGNLDNSQVDYDCETQVTSVKWIKWEFPFEGSLKLNVDGASKGTSELFGGGMVVRDSSGQMILATSVLLDGLQMVRQNRLEEKQLMIESDSQILVQMVLGKVGVPWRIKGILEQIWQELKKMQF